MGAQCRPRVETALKVRARSFWSQNFVQELSPEVLKCGGGVQFGYFRVIERIEGLRAPGPAFTEPSQTFFVVVTSTAKSSHYIGFI